MEWISILKCPITGSTLTLLKSDDLNEINSKIAARELFKTNGEPFLTQLEEALISENGEFIFPVKNKILLLLKDLALVKNKASIDFDFISADKQLVRDFYDDKGWKADDEGNYEDAVIFEDLRDVAKEYINKCHSRVNRYLNPSGTYMLDAASGALQFDAYLQYSENYKYRICVDFSFQALVEAKRKLGDKGICILCDITNLPFQDNVIDGFVSLNTIYHIPRAEQLKAFTELYRVLLQEGKGVIVYEWFKHSPWMNLWLLPFRGATFIKNRMKRAFNKISGKGEPHRMLYFHAFSYKYLKNNLPFNFELKVWRTVSVPFMKVYIHKSLFGKKMLDWLYRMEERNPYKFGLKGEYPLLVVSKPSTGALKKQEAKIFASAR